MNTPTNGSTRRQAFTLIEVLVVVMIIALLVAILIPALSRSKHRSLSVVCHSNMSQLIKGMYGYIAEQNVYPGTHSLFFLQALFGTAWPRIPGVTWDGARDRLQGLTYTAAYTKPHYLDPEFVADVPRKGTLFRHIRQEKVYTCPSDAPGEAQDTPLGGGGNGRLSYSLNAYVGYKAPEHLQAFTYVADSLNNPLPGGQGMRSFTVGQRVVFSPARFMTMFEEHPFYHMNTSFPEGNFNGLDRIATRHGLTAGSNGRPPEGRAGIAFLDGHVEGRTYPAKTRGCELFAEYGQPHVWHASGPPDTANAAAFIRRLPGPCPW